MPEMRLRFDPRNPGQFYACCGILELLHLSGVDALAQFTQDHHSLNCAEFVAAHPSLIELTHLIRMLSSAKFEPLARPNADSLPEKDTIAPIRTTISGRKITLDWWLDNFYTRATALKCWAGQVTSRKLFSELQELLPTSDVSLDSDSFTTTRFGVDPRSAWVALDLGYSPNEQGQKSRTYPVVELLAAFGLQTFRPAGDRARGFTYSLWHTPLPCVVARTASTQPWDGLRSAGYKFQIGVRGSYKVFCFAELNPA